MDRARGVTRIWNWLPAFRAVAETQHLPTASLEAHISASALSRSVKLLEEQLGQRLFERDGRQMVLSPDGKILLSAVRDAMRRVDGAMEAIAGTTMVGPLRISAPGPYATIFVLPALQRLTEKYAELRPHICRVVPPALYPQLLNGALDLALVEEPEPHKDLEVHSLGQLEFGIYAGADHALAKRDHVTMQDVLQYPFVGPPVGLTDHFPPRHKRTIVMEVSQLHVGMQACATGGLLAFLPEAIADAYRGHGTLCRLPVVVSRSRTMYAIHRRVLHQGERIVEVRRAIEEAVRGASQLSRPGSVRPPDSTVF